MERSEDRSFEEFRSIFMKEGVISRATGSAYIELGNTKVMAAVYGPRQITVRQATQSEVKLNCELEYLPFATQDKTKAALSSRQYSKIIEDIFDRLINWDDIPKSSIDIRIAIIESDGGDLAVCINCTCLALSFAGVQLKDLVAATSVVKVEDSFLLDPTNDEIVKGGEQLNVAILPQTQKVIFTIQNGNWSQQQHSEAMELTMGGCYQIDQFLRQFLKQTYEEKQ